MGKFSTYDISFKGLKEGEHSFSYRLDAQFFELFNESNVKHGLIDVELILEKRSNLLILNTTFIGELRLTCDRCLESYMQPVTQKFKVFVKFGEENNNQDDDIIWISPDKQHVNIAQILYEYIILSIPIKQIHPEKNKGEFTCNKNMLDNIKKYTVQNTENKYPDERWDALKKIKINN